MVSMVSIVLWWRLGVAVFSRQWLTQGSLGKSKPTLKAHNVWAAFTPACTAYLLFPSVLLGFLNFLPSNLSYLNFRANVSLKLTLKLPVQLFILGICIILDVDYTAPIVSAVAVFDMGDMAPCPG